jgi:Domain of unknown function (DUF4399)
MNIINKLSVIGATAILLASCASTMMADKGVSFVEPKDGATVPSEFKVVMLVKGMTVKPAGELVDGTGHHHLLIDAEPIASGEVIPATEKHMHFGKGQTETSVKLAPGKHTLQLQFANGAHQSYGPAMSKTIVVNVQ